MLTSPHDRRHVVGAYGVNIDIGLSKNIFGDFFATLINCNSQGRIVIGISAVNVLRKLTGD